MVAAYQGNAQTVELLLRFGANACLQDKRGNTALMGALLKREIQIARALYQAECADNLRNKAGLSVQEFAELYGQSETLKALHQENWLCRLPLNHDLSTNCVLLSNSQ